MSSAAPMYKVKECEPHMPGGALKIAAHAEPPTHEPLQWKVVVEPPGEDDFADKILEHVRSGRSCCIEGPPGTGKSWTLGKVKAALEEQGHNVRVVAPTHAAARLVDGETIHHFVAKYAMQGAFQGWLLIDEISMVVFASISYFGPAEAWGV